MSEHVVIGDPVQAPLLARFYDELYLPAFAHQREPLEAWTEQLWGDHPAAYDLTIDLVVDGDLISGGIISEIYPQSRCAILTYMVVAPHARNAGLGRALLAGARRGLTERGAHAVFGEVATDSYERLDRFQRWGARVVDHPYVQPDLGFGRDRALRLIAFEPLDASELVGATLRAFLREFYTVTERIEPSADAELGPLLASIPDQVALRRM